MCPLCASLKLASSGYSRISRALITICVASYLKDSSSCSRGDFAAGYAQAMPVSWSLITVAYNGASVLQRCWSDPRPADVEWIVVDNNSSDGSVAAARALGATVIESPSNLGFSAANNIGLAAAKGAYVVFVNPDVTVNYNDLPGLAARIDDVGGLVSPQLINEDRTLQPNGRGMPLLLHKVLNRTSSRDRLRGSYLLFADAEDEKYVFWLIGAVVAARIDTFEAMGGWNEKFFLYYEDKDIAIRAWRAGYPVVLLGGFRWVHGWARETTKFKLKPWIREISSLTRFYSLYPEFLMGGKLARRRNPEASARAGTLFSRGAQKNDHSESLVG